MVLMFLIPAVWRLRQEDWKSKASFGYILKRHLNKVKSENEYDQIVLDRYLQI